MLFDKNNLEIIKLRICLSNPNLANFILYRKLRKYIHTSNSYDPNFEPELLFVNDFLEEDAVVIDVGANWGHYLYALTNDKKKKNIYAFEPLRPLSKLLQSNFRTVKVFNTALSDFSGESIIRIPYIKQRRFYSRATLADHSEENETSIKFFPIKTKTLDHFISDQKIGKLDFIKIDVEGHEIKVLAGASNTILTMKPLMQIEIEQRHHSEISVNEIIKNIEDLGYSGFFYNKNSNSFNSVDELNNYNYQDSSTFKTINYNANFLFIPNENLALYKVKMKLIENKFKHK